MDSGVGWVDFLWEKAFLFYPTFAQGLRLIHTVGSFPLLFLLSFVSVLMNQRLVLYELEAVPNQSFLTFIALRYHVKAQKNNRHKHGATPQEHRIITQAIHMNNLSGAVERVLALMLLNAYPKSGNDCQTHIFYGKMCPKTELVESKIPGESCLSISLVTGLF